MVTGSPLLSAIFAGFLQYVEAILLTAVKWRTCGVVCLCRFSHSTSPAWDAVPVAMLLPTQHLGSFETFKPTDHDNVSNPLRGGNSFMGPKVMTLWPLKCLNLTWSLGVWQRARSISLFLTKNTVIGMTSHYISTWKLCLERCKKIWYYLLRALWLSDKLT